MMKNKCSCDRFNVMIFVFSTVLPVETLLNRGEIAAASLASELKM